MRFKIFTDAARNTAVNAAVVSRAIVSESGGVPTVTSIGIEPSNAPGEYCPIRGNTAIILNPMKNAKPNIADIATLLAIVEQNIDTEIIIKSTTQ